MLPRRRKFGAQIRDVEVRSDSVAALSTAAALKSKSPTLNDLAAELALELARESFAISITEHVPGASNKWADALSRLDQLGSGAVVPGDLCAVQRTLNVCSCRTISYATERRRTATKQLVSSMKSCNRDLPHLLRMARIF